MRIKSGIRKAFVLMPFQRPFDSYYPAVFRPALESAGYEVSRANDLFAPRPIMLDIQKSIIDSNLILCEMSGKNPNVFYELGLAHAIGRPAILVSNEKEDIPFDLRHIRVILYDNSIAGWEDRLRENIKAAAQAINDIDVWPSPLVLSPSYVGFPPTGPASGKILEPRPNAVLSGAFSYRVELSNPSLNKFYYFVHEVSGQYWPKDRILPRTGGKPISGQSNEGGGGIPSNGIFHIVLLEVDEVEHHRIQQWLAGPAWPRGIQEIEGLQLDKIEVVFR